MMRQSENLGELSMNFALKAAGDGTAEDTVVAKFTPHEKQMVMAWLEKSLELDQFSDSDHPLKGIIEISTPLVEVEDVEDILSKLDAAEEDVSFSPREFIALSAVADMWKGDHRVTELDDHVHANREIYDQRPELRDYILSDAYQQEIKAFDGVIDTVQAAHDQIYPDKTVIDNVDFRANNDAMS